METTLMYWGPEAFKSYKPTDQEMQTMLNGFYPTEVMKGRTTRLNEVLHKCKDLNFDLVAVVEKIVTAIESERAQLDMALGKELATEKIALAYSHIQNSANSIYGNMAFDEYLTTLGIHDPKKEQKIAELCNNGLMGKFDSNNFDWKVKSIVVLIEYLKKKKQDRYAIWDSLSFLAHETGISEANLENRKEQISLAMEKEFSGN